MTPLTPIEFRDALRKGLGRAVVHLRNYGAAGLEADLLHACLNSLCHDPQSEGTRSEWLWYMLGLAGMKEVARPHLGDFRKSSMFEANIPTVKPAPTSNISRRVFLR